MKLPPLGSEIKLSNTGPIRLENSVANGVVSLNDGVVRHLDTLTNDLQLNLNEFSIKGPINVPKVQLTGKYTADVTLTNSSAEKQKLVGSGNLDVTATDVTINVNCDIILNPITKKLSIRTLNFEPKITSANLIMDGATVNGKPLDTKAFCKDLTGMSGITTKMFGKNENREMRDKIRGAINNELDHYSLPQIMEKLGQK